MQISTLGEPLSRGFVVCNKRTGLPVFKLTEPGGMITFVYRSRAQAIDDVEFNERRGMEVRPVFMTLGPPIAKAASRT